MPDREEVYGLAITALECGISVYSRLVRTKPGARDLRWFADDGAEFGYGILRIAQANRGELGHSNAMDALVAVAKELGFEPHARLRDLRLLADGCPQHSSYRAKRKISTTCDTCNAMWEARQRLNDPAKGG